MSGSIVSVLQCLCQLDHFLHSLRLEQVSVVKMVKKDIQAAFSVIDLGLEGGRRTGFYALHVDRQNIKYGLSFRRNMATISGGCPLLE